MLRHLLRAYVLRRLLGGGHRHRRGPYWGWPGGSWGAPGRYGPERMRRPGRGLFDVYRPRRRTRVRGCGCCLPIPLGALAVGALVFRLLLRVMSR